jgi:hypothetical protein
MKVGFDARDRLWCHELAIGVQGARPVEDNAAARPVFVFVGLHQGAQGGIHNLVAAPVRPGFVMARAVGETIAIMARPGPAGSLRRADAFRPPSFAPPKIFRRAASRGALFRSCCHRASAFSKSCPPQESGSSESPAPEPQSGAESKSPIEGAPCGDGGRTGLLGPSAGLCRGDIAPLSKACSCSPVESRKSESENRDDLCSQALVSPMAVLKAPAPETAAPGTSTGAKGRLFGGHNDRAVVLIGWPISGCNQRRTGCPKLASRAALHARKAQDMVRKNTPR